MANPIQKNFEFGITCGEDANTELARQMFLECFAQNANQYEVDKCILNMSKKKGRKTPNNTTCNWDVYFQRWQEPLAGQPGQFFRPRITNTQASEVVRTFAGTSPHGCNLIGYGRYKDNDSGMKLVFSVTDCECKLNFRLSQTQHPIEGCYEMYLLLDSIIPGDMQKEEIRDCLQDVLLKFASESDQFDVVLDFDREFTIKKAMNIHTAIDSIESMWQKANTDPDDLVDWLVDSQINYDDMEKSGGDAINGSLEESVSLPDSSNGCKICK